MKKILSRTVASGALVVLATAAPALASSYYSSSNPLNAVQDGVIQAQMYGRFSILNLTYARNDYTYRDARPGGDAAYVETFYKWYRPDGTLYSDIGTDTSPKITTETWTGSADQHELQGAANKVRMYANVCEDHGVWVKDPCSVKPTEIFSY